MRPLGSRGSVRSASRSSKDRVGMAGSMFGSLPHTQLVQISQPQSMSRPGRLAWITYRALGRERLTHYLHSALPTGSNHAEAQNHGQRTRTTLAPLDHRFVTGSRSL